MCQSQESQYPAAVVAIEGQKDAKEQDAHNAYEFPKKMPKQILGGFPWTAIVILLVEAAERFAFYSASLTFTKYMQNMLGLPANTSSSIRSAFNFAAFGTGVIGAFVADKWIGKYKTIVVFGLIYFLGLCCLALSSFPFAFNTWPNMGPGTPNIESDADGSFAQYGYYIALVLIAFGTGSIKSNIGPFLADNVVGNDDNKVEKIFRWFYWGINAGGFVGILWGPQSHLYGNHSTYNASTSTYDGSSYWLNFSVSAGVFLLAYISFVVCKKWYIQKLPNGTVYTTFYNVCSSAVKKGWSNANGNEAEIRDVRKTINVFKLFVLFPIFFFAYNQMGDTFINQATWMTRPKWLGVEALNLFDCIAIICLIPAVEVILPMIRKLTGWEIGPVARISAGYVFTACGFWWVYVLQRILLNNGEFSGPDAADLTYNAYPGKAISIWWQIPGYMFIGLGEIFCSVTLLEVAYSQAPKDMKSMVMALANFTIAFAMLVQTCMGELLTFNVYENFFLAIAIILMVTSPVNYFLYRTYDFGSKNEHIEETVECDNTIVMEYASNATEKKASIVA
eukprot:Nk52_evm21s554 gene=Nk52_evmTU21s554